MVTRHPHSVGMKNTLRGVAFALIVLFMLPSPVQAAPTLGIRPADGDIVRPFDPPALPWGSGHRGIDLSVAAGSEIRAPLGGVVTFAGVVVDRPVVVITHGQTRTTLEPVSALVEVGTTVTTGQVIGRLEPGHACSAPSCLHWGLLRGEQYLNPLSVLTGPVRLLSDAEAARITTQT